ncbi:MAG: 30S ribosomal protein S20 [Opitutaceae bacterium]|nr:30S ribosomal protein S20 [Opitutaceae bacterium]|tara:strand:- start:2102 stop:2359 length:258 start_codon:yes stop_codon:yes gene_type:complete
MANTKSAIKNIRKTAGQTQRNMAIKSRLKTLKKKVVVAAESGDKDATKVAAIAFVSALDKAAKTKIIHQNSARRLKASCAKYIFA